MNEPLIDTSKQTMVVARGLPGSGKSFWAKKFLGKYPAFRRVNRDELRLMYNNRPFDKDVEKLVKKSRDLLLEAALAAGHSIISDDTNLSPKTVAELEGMANKHNASVQFADFTDVPVEVCVQRDAMRQNPVGSKVILKMYNDLLKKPDPKYVPPITGLPECIISDLDGTLAILNGRNPYDASTCEQDVVNHAVLSVIAMFMKINSRREKVIFFSGREDKYREQTQNWLANVCNLDGPVIGERRWELHMRKTGDVRRDAIVKREMFDAHVHGKYTPVFWLDDRQQVVDMVRHDLGVPLFQVNYGYF